MARENINKEEIEWDASPAQEEVEWDDSNIAWDDVSEPEDEYQGSKWMTDVGKTVTSLGSLEPDIGVDVTDGEYEGIPFLKDHLTTENFLKAVTAPFYPLQKARETMTAAMNVAAKDPVTGKVLGWLDDEAEVDFGGLPGVAEGADMFEQDVMQSPGGRVLPVSETVPVAIELAALHPYTVGGIRVLKGAAKLAGKPVSRLFTGLGEGGIEGAELLGDTRGLAAEAGELTQAQTGLTPVTKTQGQFPPGRTRAVKTVGAKGGRPDAKAPIYTPEEAAHQAPRPDVSTPAGPAGEAKATEDILLDIEIDRTLANPPIHPGASRTTPEATGMPGVRRDAKPLPTTAIPAEDAADALALETAAPTGGAHPGATPRPTPQDVSTIFKRGGAGEPMTVGELPPGGPEDFLPIRPGVAHPGATGAPGPLPVENAAINAGNAEQVLQQKAVLQDRFLRMKTEQAGGVTATGTAPRVGAPRPQTRGISNIPDSELTPAQPLPGRTPAPVAAEPAPVAEVPVEPQPTPKKPFEIEAGATPAADTPEMQEAIDEAAAAVERAEASSEFIPAEDVLEANLSFEGPEGAASTEGINAVESMKRRGIKRKIINQYKPNKAREQALTVDARDYVPQADEIVIEIDPEVGTTIVATGKNVKPVRAQTIVDNLFKGDESHMLEGIDTAIRGLKTHDHATNLRRMVDAGKLQPEQAARIQQAIEIVAAEKGKDGIRAADVLKRIRQPKGHVAGEAFDVTAEGVEVPEAATYEIPDTDYELPESVMEPYEPDVGVDKTLKKTGYVSEEETQAQLDRLMAEKGIAPEDLGMTEKPAFDVEAPAAEPVQIPKTQKEIASKLDELGQEQFNHVYNPVNLEAQLVKELEAGGMSRKAAKANARARMTKYEKDYNKVNQKALKARAAEQAKKEAKLSEKVMGVPAPVYGHINLVEHPAYAIGLERAASFRLEDFSHRMISYARDYLPDALKDALKAEELLAAGSRKEGAALAEKVVEQFRKAAHQATGGNPAYLDTLRSPRQILADINKAIGKRGSVGAGELTTEQRQAIQRLKRDYDSLKKKASITGRSVREFLIDNGYSEAIADSVVKSIEKTAPIAGAAQESTEDLRTFFDKKFVNTREGVEKTIKGAKEFINTPIVAARKDPIAKEAIKIADRADIQGQAFAADRSKIFARQTKKLKKDYAARERIGEFLDNVDNVPDAERAAHYGLGQEEERVALWMQEEFDDLLWHWGRERLVSAGEPASQLKVVVDLAKAGGDPTGLTKAEAEVYDVFRRKLKDYLPHIFDRRDLAAELAAEMKVTTDPAKLTKLQASLHDVQGGRLLLYEQLPDKVKMRFFAPRKGKEGYKLDAFEAYNAYLQGITRKMFDEPVVRHMKSVFPQISPEYQPFMSEFTRNYMGWNRKGTDAFWHTLRSAEWMRTLGLNPRSAFVNLTQGVNTIVEAGPRHSLAAYRKMFTRESRELWRHLGLEQEAHTAMMGALDKGTKMEKVRRVTGWMFAQAENFNKKHAFLAGMEKFAHLKGAERIQRATDLMHKTQFRYGRVGMPMGLQKGAPSVALQFSSYPIKQLELMWHWARTNPKKLVAYLAAAEGGRWFVGEYGDLDLSNQLGFGVNYGELVKVIKSIGKKEWMNAVRHWRVAKAQGTGILPQGGGPALQAASDLASGKLLEDPERYIREHISPVMLERLLQAYDAIKFERGGRYPIHRKGSGELKYTLPAVSLAQRTFFFTPMEETRKRTEHLSRGMARHDLMGISREISDLMAQGKRKEALALMKKYPLAIPTYKSMIEGHKRRRIPEARRDRLNTGKSRMFYEQGER